MDQFKNRASGLDSPGYNAASLAPDDGNDLAYVTRAVWVGVAGDLSVVLASGDAVTFKNASGWMPLRVKRLNATDTTASDVVGVW
ncbi:spike base protein, RCAP_Rcc01079 family [Cohaesibacter celericrescens]|uniref:DUF2793 domain-containing protein n=1 Tax=Cohaesibacter celericrescens TaxID=2067669 RepID=A0A2N5XQK3_9HYPH|nr:hypothetical protein [Cohaesibacter celericrescens]PLW76796.1 hypothetical protein C0081_12095 [Cohaesibacter celericrescens]